MVLPFKLYTLFDGLAYNTETDTFKLVLQSSWHLILCKMQTKIKYSMPTACNNPWHFIYPKYVYHAEPREAVNYEQTTGQNRCSCQYKHCYF